MGNAGSHVGALRTAILSNDVVSVANILAEYQNRRSSPNAWELLWQPLNRKGDTALSLAARRGYLEITRALLEAGSNVNLKNRLGETALDVSLSRVLPSDGDILHHHFCPYSHAGCEAPLILPEIVKLLMRRGAQGASLEKLIMHAMRDEQRVKELIDLIPNLTDSSMYRISGLLLQSTVWFHHIKNLECLLKMGVNMENFWGARFMPDIVPNTAPLISRNVMEWPQEQSGEYSLPDLHHSDSVQSLKFSFVQDWCADWDDGENPDAQFRAGLHITPDSAVVFSRATSCGHVLMLIMNDVMSYVPEACSGPELNRTNLIGCLLLAGYHFSDQETRYLQLAFNIDFHQFEDFLTQPKTLKHLSRLCIRQNMMLNVYHGLEHLNDVPRPLKDYILLKMDYPHVEPNS